MNPQCGQEPPYTTSKVIGIYNNFDKAYKEATMLEIYKNYKRNGNADDPYIKQLLDCTNDNYNYDENLFEHYSRNVKKEGEAEYYEAKIHKYKKEQIKLNALKQNIIETEKERNKDVKVMADKYFKHTKTKQSIPRQEIQEDDGEL
jgi:hypothetical protein